jgi:uncharacterized protein with von Willebrand factor type A (vWA) domain
LPLSACDMSQGDGRLIENLVYFGRTLRAAGLPVGPGKLIDAVEALRTVGLSRRDDFYWALHSVLVSRRDQRPIFDQAFHLFWRNPQLLERMMSLVLPSFNAPEEKDKDEIARRLAEALAAESSQEPPPLEETEIDTVLTWSDREVLRTTDFEKMSALEEAEAKRAIAALHFAIRPVSVRRYRADPGGSRIDPRGSLRATLRQGGGAIPLRFRERRKRRPPLVVLCDISGSMARYSRLFLYFIHRAANEHDRFHAFLFGTRLTNITRALRSRDVDEAVAEVSSQVVDWSGGTRIGACLAEFNRLWSRRVLAQGAIVLLITDGLDREGGTGLAAEMARLKRSCRRIIWLNPLLRYDLYEPKAMGARAILPYVDEFRPVHNLESLDALADALSRPAVAHLARPDVRPRLTAV